MAQRRVLHSSVLWADLVGDLSLHRTLPYALYTILRPASRSKHGSLCSNTAYLLTSSLWCKHMNWLFMNSLFRKKLFKCPKRACFNIAYCFSCRKGFLLNVSLNVHQVTWKRCRNLHWLSNMFCIFWCNCKALWETRQDFFLKPPI